ncbi:hypothetical protein PR048_004373 [Dryococelus australis]|uniref:Uncharacterized protein n=1 Tax=Dryococelus australis TaxID=614101 RepID=A0ABQ9I6C7_9NEOP|nr:hypothetical protein PR048_004373 [Dryococelus australis]
MNTSQLCSPITCGSVREGVSSHVCSSQWRNDAGSRAYSTVKFSLMPNKREFCMHLLISIGLSSLRRKLDLTNLCIRVTSANGRHVFLSPLGDKRANNKRATNCRLNHLDCCLCQQSRWTISSVWRSAEPKIPMILFEVRCFKKRGLSKGKWDDGVHMPTELSQRLSLDSCSPRRSRKYELCGIGKIREFNALKASTVLCIPESQLFVHWLLPHRVASVTSHLAVWHSLFVSLQVCYWLRVVQGVSNKLTFNCKVNFSVHLLLIIKLWIFLETPMPLPNPVILAVALIAREPVLRLGWSCASKAKKRGSDTGDTNTEVSTEGLTYRRVADLDAIYCSFTSLRVVASNHAQSGQNGSGFTFMQQPMQKRLPAPVYTALSLLMGVQRSPLVSPCFQARTREVRPDIGTSRSRSGLSKELSLPGTVYRGVEYVNTVSSRFPFYRGPGVSVWGRMVIQLGSGVPGVLAWDLRPPPLRNPFVARARWYLGESLARLTPRDGHLFPFALEVRVMGGGGSGHLHIPNRRQSHDRLRGNPSPCPRLACSPPTKANQVQPPAGSPDFPKSGNRSARCRWSVRFLGDLLFSLTLSCPCRTLITLIGYQDLAYRNARAGETGDPRENPLTSGIVRRDSHARKSGSDPAWTRVRFAWTTVIIHEGTYAGLSLDMCHVSSNADMCCVEMVEYQPYQRKCFNILLEVAQKKTLSRMKKIRKELEVKSVAQKIKECETAEKYQQPAPDGQTAPHDSMTERVAFEQGNLYGCSDIRRIFCGSLCYMGGSVPTEELLARVVFSEPVCKGADFVFDSVRAVFVISGTRWFRKPMYREMQSPSTRTHFSVRSRTQEMRELSFIRFQQSYNTRQLYWNCVSRVVECKRTVEVRKQDTGPEELISILP